MSLSVAEMSAYNLRVCAWCMEYRDLTELEEVVIREPSAPRGTKGLVREEAAWQGTARSERQVCWRCVDRAACAAADVARFANDPPYRIERVKGD